MINEANVLKRINDLDQLKTGDTVFVKLHDVYEIIFDEMSKASEASRGITIPAEPLNTPPSWWNTPPSWNTTPIITCTAPDVNISDCVKSISQT